MIKRVKQFIRSQCWLLTSLAAQTDPWPAPFWPTLPPLNCLPTTIDHRMEILNTVNETKKRHWGFKQLEYEHEPSPQPKEQIQLQLEFYFELESHPNHKNSRSSPTRQQKELLCFLELASFYIVQGARTCNWSFAVKRWRRLSDKSDFCATIVEANSSTYRKRFWEICRTKK